MASTMVVGLALVAWALRPSTQLAERSLVQADDNRPPWVPEDEEVGVTGSNAEFTPARLLLKNGPAGVEIRWSTSASLYGDETVRKPEDIPSARY